MSLIQAILIAFLGAITSRWSPVCYGQVGAEICGRPLIAGFLCGLILGDIPSGIIIGAAIQAVYIGVVNVGGSVAANINLAQWIAIPLTIIARGTSDTALAMAIPLSVIGTLFIMGVKNINLIFIHYMDRLIDEGKFHSAALVPVWGNITNFLAFFIPITLFDYFGADSAEAVLAALPMFLTKIMSIFGGIMPLLGFTILLSQILKKKVDLIFYFFGFLLITIFKLDMISIVVIACTIAYIIYSCTSGKNAQKEVNPL